jgi:hypothetical protein
MNLIVLKEEELQDIEHFSETGKRKDGLTATDKWVEESLAKSAKEVRELQDRCDVHWQTAEDFCEITQAARKLYRAWRKKEPVEGLFQELGTALNR